MSDETDRRRGRRVRPYTTREAAEILGVSQQMVIRLCNSGALECHRTSDKLGAPRRIRVSVLEKYIEATG